MLYISMNCLSTYGTLCSLLQVLFYHTYDQPGQYDIVLNVSNDFLPAFELTTITVFIEEGINSTVISNPEYGVTHEPVLFEVLPHTGLYLYANISAWVTENIL